MSHHFFFSRWKSCFSIKDFIASEHKTLETVFDQTTSPQGPFSSRPEDFNHIIQPSSAGGVGLLVMESITAHKQLINGPCGDIVLSTAHFKN